MKEDVRYHLMKKKGNKEMPTPNRNSFITPSLHLCLLFVCVNILSARMRSEGYSKVGSVCVCNYSLILGANAQRGLQL